MYLMKPPKRKVIPTKTIYGVAILVLFVLGGLLFHQQLQLSAENARLQQLTEEKSQGAIAASIAASDQHLSDVKNDLDAFKLLSAEADNALLKKTEEQKPAVIVQKISEPSVATIIKNWRPVMARIVCDFRYTNGTLYARQTGSGTLLTDKNGRALITNKHVVADKQGYGPTTCTIHFPNNDAAYTIGIDDIKVSGNGSDKASIATNGLPASIGGKTTRKYCSATPEIGDEIIILGYPNIGGSDVTATEGIIASYDGSYYVTSAKVEQGNSGGAAIDLTHNCYLGIPTFAEAGQIESLARILKWQAF